ncbi:hypothetical protein FMN50_11860 [Rhodobacterales bacterium]|nr:hypothetical protein FMN50_11860 [Rhodobacterales bacterium]
MDIRNSSDLLNQTVNAGFRPAVFFLIAALVLLLMSAALKPALALPLVAFVAMATSTRLLARRVFRDLAFASHRSER